MVQSTPHSYCVCHGPNPDRSGLDNTRVFFLSPQYGHVHPGNVFLPIYLPKLTVSKRPPSSHEKLSICVVGGVRAMRKFKNNSGRCADLLAAYLLHPPPVPLEINFFASRLLRPFDKPDFQELVRLRAVPDFVAFSQGVAQCDILLPLIEPQINSEYFQGQLTGNIPLAVAYKIPLVLHEDMKTIYEKYITDIPTETYVGHSTNVIDKLESFSAAMNRMITRLTTPPK
eukprot:Selendium_serpulae@DN3808_c0_g1_i6.p1